MVAFNLPGGLPVYAFSLLVGLGAMLGLGWSAGQVARQEGREAALRQVDAGAWALVGALIGGRLAYVALSWSYFQDRLAEIPLVFQGGLAWPGALAGGLLGLMIYADLRRLSPGALADRMLGLVAALGVSAWLGCWLDGCAYGPPTNAWWGIPGRDEWGVLAQRWPVQLFGALLTLELFWLLELLSLRPPGRLAPGTGRVAGLGVLGLSLIILLLSFLRADPAPRWLGLRPDAWAALGFVAGSVIILWLLSRNHAAHPTAKGDQAPPEP